MKYPIPNYRDTIAYLDKFLTKELPSQLAILELQKQQVLIWQQEMLAEQQAIWQQLQQPLSKEQVQQLTTRYTCILRDIPNGISTLSQLVKEIDGYQHIHNSITTDKQFYEAIAQGNLEAVNTFVKNKPGIVNNCFGQNDYILSSLGYAVHQGQIEIAKFLLQSGWKRQYFRKFHTHYSPGCEDRPQRGYYNNGHDESTYLLWLTAFTNQPMFNMLLANGLQPRLLYLLSDMMSQGRKTDLTGTVLRLIETSRIHPLTDRDEAEKVLCAALQNNNQAVVEWLFALDPSWQAGQNVLTAAVEGGNTLLLQLCLSKAPQALLKDVPIQLLHAAARQDNPSMLQEVLSFFPLEAINTPDSYGKAALHLAAEKGNKAIIKMLLARNANKTLPVLNSKTSTQCAFHLAISYCCADDPELLDLLWDDSLDINALDQRGGTLLHSAIRENAPRMVAWLIEKGADVNQPATCGKTPLHTSPLFPNRRRNPEILRLLLNHPNIQLQEANLITAIRDNDIQCFQYIIDKMPTFSDAQRMRVLKEALHSPHPVTEASLVMRATALMNDKIVPHIPPYDSYHTLMRRIGEKGLEDLSMEELKMLHAARSEQQAAQQERRLIANFAKFAQSTIRIIGRQKKDEHIWNLRKATLSIECPEFLPPELFNHICSYLNSKPGPLPEDAVSPAASTLTLFPPIKTPPFLEQIKARKHQLENGNNGVADSHAAKILRGQEKTGSMKRG